MLVIVCEGLVARDLVGKLKGARMVAKYIFRAAALHRLSKLLSGFYAATIMVSMLQYIDHWIDSYGRLRSRRRRAIALYM